MKQISISTVTAAALATVAMNALAQSSMYRWVDANGRVHYGDSRPTTPAKSVEQRQLGANVVETSGLDYATREAAKNFPVTLFVAPNCETACAQAREVLSKRGVPFKEVNVTDERSRKELTQASGDTQVPVLVVGKQVSKGFEAEAFQTALDAAGYPRSGKPAKRSADASADKNAASEANGRQKASSDADVKEKAANGATRKTGSDPEASAGTDERAKPKGRYLP